MMMRISFKLTREGHLSHKKNVSWMGCDKICISSKKIMSTCDEKKKHKIDKNIYISSFSCHIHKIISHVCLGSSNLHDKSSIYSHIWTSLLRYKNITLHINCNFTWAFPSPLPCVYHVFYECWTIAKKKGNKCLQFEYLVKIFFTSFFIAISSYYCSVGIIICAYRMKRQQ